MFYVTLATLLKIDVKKVNGSSERGLLECFGRLKRWLGMGQ